jgi:integrase
VEFFAYTGLRLGEARNVQWKHIDRERNEVVVVGDPNEGTKNRTIRRVPIIAALADLLQRIEERVGKQPPSAHLITIKKATTALNQALKELNMHHISHHDFRHLFATNCIEAVVDIPTVAGWLGHKDKGALAMRVYGHLRNEHSQAAAKKVTFGA